MKTCTKCGIEKDESEFLKEKRAKGGITSTCKECARIRSKRFRDNNKDKIKQYRDTFKEKNPEKLIIYSKNKWQKIKSNQKKHESKKKYMLKWHHDHYTKKERKKRIINFTRDYVLLKSSLKKQIGETPPPELVEVKLLINKTKRLCKTLKNCETL